jgi:hypothetical protein
MGIQLITQALHPYWGQHLDPTARLILIRMARTAQDHGTDAGQYFAGHAALALTLTGEDTANARRSVRRAIGHLIKAGAVTRIRHANTGGKYSTAAYQLTLDSHGPHPVDNQS